MKRYSYIRKAASLRVLCSSLLLGMMLPLSATAGFVSLATSPLANSTSGSVKPNIMFVLDDSGSMGWDYLPDWANTGTAYLSLNSGYNGVTYNPAVRYIPPAMFTSLGGLDTTTYPSMTGDSVVTGANTSAAMPNWQKVKFDGYGKQLNSNGDCPDGSGSATCNLDNSASRPMFYTFVAGEYCSLPDLKTCHVQAAADATYPYPATLRWCTSSAMTNCRKTHSDATYTFARYPRPRTASFTINSLSSTPSITGITVNGLQIMATSASASSTSALARAVRDQINACNGKITGSCGVAGYAATVSGSTVTITAGLGSVTPVSISKSGSISLSTSAPTFSTSATPGNNLLTVITPGTTSVYPYPGTTSKAATRTDCASSLCTGNEEMINYANWFAYYHTRLQMMKTSVSNAFKTVDERFRVGFSTIHYSGSATDSNANFLNVQDFDTTQKYKWYVKFFNQTAANGTPLRSSLSKAGRYFANKISGQTDPMQYACQKNFTLLTTDGYWNTDAASDVKTVTGGTLGDMDSDSTTRPKYEGGTASNGMLADVAKYYFDTDLRTSALGNCTGIMGTDVCGTPTNYPNQNMVTFTLGLGVDGSLQFQSDYKTATYGDFKNIKLGSGTPHDWPVPQADHDTAVDDLWHAAVNGGGTYFSAKDPASLASGLTTALSEISSVLGSGAAAATSTFTPTQGDNFIYEATYTTVDWTGNLLALSIDLSTGAPSTVPTWCAEDVTDPLTGNIICHGTMAGRQTSATSDNRKIYFNNGGNLTDFNYSNLVAAGKSTNFEIAFISAHLSQWNYLDITTQQPNAVKDKLVNYLRGNTGYEDKAPNDATHRVFRARKATLGDAFESQPGFMGAPTYSYTDAGYTAFKTAQANRGKTVYVGTNDGMLHAFNATENSADPQQAQERWAYIPSMVIPNMWKLADANYSTSHANFINGTPYIGDVYDGSSWHTILVGGLNGGGRGYYALDITNPDSPSLLWEIDPSKPGFGNLGYTFGFPIITKKSDGTWVVLLTSGYDNGTLAADGSSNSPAGDGKGYLYVVNAMTGTLIRTMGTNTGSPTSPSGLSKISGWADDPTINNAVTYTYGGDLEGNVWRFDINAATSGVNPFKLAVLKDTGGAVQPITTEPALANMNNRRMLFIGTGKYLEPSDLSDNQQQTMYAFLDDESASPTTLFAPNGTMVQQTMTNINGNTQRTITSNAVDLFTQRGWYINLPDTGERVNVNPTFFYGILLFPTLVPSATICTPGGYGWLNYVNIMNGGIVSGVTIAAQKTPSPIVGPPIKEKLPCDGTGGCKEITLVPGADGKVIQMDGVPEGGGSGQEFQAHQTVWRVLKQ